MKQHILSIINFPESCTWNIKYKCLYNSFFLLQHCERDTHGISPCFLTVSLEQAQSVNDVKQTTSATPSHFS